MRISKIAQGFVKVPAVKPDNLNLIPRTNMIEGVKQLQQRMRHECFAYVFVCALDECLCTMWRLREGIRFPGGGAGKCKSAKCSLTAGPTLQPSYPILRVVLTTVA